MNLETNLANVVLDSSKLSAYEECRRKYFYSHVLGWRPDMPNIHLEAGVAVHLACEHMLLAHKATGTVATQDVADAYRLFEAHYRKFFPPDTDAKNSPKDPANILVMLSMLSEHFNKTLVNTEVLYTEVGGTILVGEQPIAFKIDALVRNERGIVVVDFKTASQDSIAGRAQYTLTTQMGTYLFVAEAVFGADERVYGNEIIQLVLRKAGNAINSIPIVRTPEHMLAWLFDTEYYIGELRWNLSALAEAKESDAVMQAFPRNPTACTKYGICPYHAFCTAWANPLQHCEAPPPGFRVEHWNPLTVERTARYVMRDGQLEESKAAAEERAKVAAEKEDTVLKGKVEGSMLYEGLF